jgi:hypothetical protein
MATCPKCTGDVPKTWTNSRRQIVGKCASCRKLVILGRQTKQPDGQANPDVQKNGKVQGPGKGKEHGKAAPAASAGSGAKPAANGGVFARIRKFLDTPIG